MSKLEDLADRVERLVLRHEELKRTNTLLEQQLAAMTSERDSLRSRLGAARSRIDVVARAPACGQRRGRGRQMKQIEVTILGQSYILGCPDGGEALLGAAVASVDREMSGIRDAGKVKARERIAVLAALEPGLSAGRTAGTLPACPCAIRRRARRATPSRTSMR